MPIALGLALELAADPSQQLAHACEAEARGCESIWLESGAGDDAISTLATLAGKTSELRLGLWLPALGARHPLVSAREIAALDRDSGGRVEVGIADDGGAAVHEAITLCKRLWCDPSVEHRGDCFALEETALEPRPMQKPWPRIHLGGNSEASIDRAARMTDGWVASGHTPASIAENLGLLRARRFAAETHDGRFQVTVRTEPRDQGELELWQSIGVDRLIVSLAALRRLR